MILFLVRLIAVAVAIFILCLVAAVASVILSITKWGGKR